MIMTVSWRELMPFPKKYSAVILVFILPLLLGSCDRPNLGFVWLQHDLLVLIGGGDVFLPSALRELCESDLQGFVNPVANVEGYAAIPYADRISLPKIIAGEGEENFHPFGCFPCLEELVRDQYAYVESYYVAKEGLQHSYYGSRDMETGLYRYTLETRDSEMANCAEFDDWVLRSRRADVSQSFVPATDLARFRHDYNQYKPLLGERCIVKKRIEKLSAPYVYETRREVIQPTTWFLIRSNIVRFRAWVYERESRRSVAIEEHYSLVVTTSGESKKSVGGCSTERLPPLKKILLGQQRGGFFD